MVVVAAAVIVVRGVMGVIPLVVAHNHRERERGRGREGGGVKTISGRFSCASLKRARQPGLNVLKATRKARIRQLLDVAVNGG